MPLNPSYNSPRDNTPATVEVNRRLLNQGAGAIVHDAFWQNKGDIAVGGSRFNAKRITPGADGTFLKSDSTNETGYSWDTPSGGSGAKTATFIIGPAANADSASYDYTTDGTDDDVQIQAAIDALPASGGKIVLREGTYTLGGLVTVDKPDVAIAGMNWATVITLKNSFDFVTHGAVFLIDEDRFCLSSLKVDGNSAGQTTHAPLLDCTNAADELFLDRVFITDGGGSLVTGSITTLYATDCRFVLWGLEGSGDWYCIDVGGGVFIRGSYFENTETNCICINGVPNRSYVVDCQSSIPGSYNQTWFLSVGGLIKGCSFDIGNSVGSECLIIEATLSEAVVESNLFYFGTSADVLSVAVEIANGLVTGNYISGGGRGVITLSESKVSSNHIITVRGHGVYVDGDDSVIIGNIIENAGAASDNTYDGVYITAGSERNNVTSNRVKNGSAVDHRYGINVSDASCTNNIVSNNILTDAQTGQFNDAGTGTVTDGSNVTS